MLSMKTKVFDLSKTLKNYSNVWLALDPRSLKVIASGKKPKNVLTEAREKGIMQPVLTRAPQDYSAYIL